jgi:hypothetical protein
VTPWYAIQLPRTWNRFHHQIEACPPPTEPLADPVAHQWLPYSSCTFLRKTYPIPRYSLYACIRSQRRAKAQSYVPRVTVCLSPNFKSKSKKCLCAFKNQPASVDCGVAERNLRWHRLSQSWKTVRSKHLTSPGQALRGICNI